MKKTLFTTMLGLCMMAACNTAPKGESSQNGQAKKQHGTNRECGYSMADEEAAFSAKIDGNNVIISNNEKAFESFYGFDDLCYTSSEPIELKNLKGSPRSLNIGYIGQDYNPILSAILENGDLQILSLFDCLQKSDFAPAGSPLGCQNKKKTYLQIYKSNVSSSKTKSHEHKEIHPDPDTCGHPFAGCASATGRNRQRHQIGGKQHRLESHQQQSEHRENPCLA